MDILIYCNDLHTRTYLNAEVIKESDSSFIVMYGDGKTQYFEKTNYSYSIN